MSSAAKKCQVCGHENAGPDFFCRNCGTEISFAPPKSPKPATTDASIPRQRTCPRCHQESDGVLRLCSHCGFDLFAAETLSLMPAKKLFLSIDGHKYECHAGDVVGREGTVAKDYFATVGTVSRRHLSFAWHDDRWFVVALAGVKNLTQLDGREMPRGVEEPLSGEHRLRLSTLCEVRLSVE
jgi:hypothetical protein